MTWPPPAVLIAPDEMPATDLDRRYLRAVFDVIAHTPTHRARPIPALEKCPICDGLGRRARTANHELGYWFCPNSHTWFYDAGRPTVFTVNYGPSPPAPDERRR